MSEYSSLATQAVLCANDQGKFWELPDTIFANYGFTYTTNFLQQAAASLGLDQNEFDSCLAGGKYYAEVDNLNRYASEQGITSTPSFLVNRQPADKGSINQVIEAQLKQTN